MATEEMVTISRSEYERLKKDSDWLGYLEAAGVDNWSGYSEAQSMRRADKEAEDEESEKDISFRIWPSTPRCRFLRR